jgi:hypothetical protein
LVATRPLVAVRALVAVRFLVMVRFLVAVRFLVTVRSLIAARAVSRVHGSLSTMCPYGKLEVDDLLSRGYPAYRIDELIDRSLFEHESGRPRL